MRFLRSSRCLALAAAAVLASSAAAQSRPARPARRSPASIPATQADIARLQQQLDEQRALMLHLLQREREHLDLLTRRLGGQVPVTAAPLPTPERRTGPVALPETPPSNEPPLKAESLPATPSSAASSRKSQSASKRGSSAPAAAAETVGSVTGRVSVQGGALDNAVVYVDSLKDKPARGRTHEIKQVNKQFAPRFSVVPRGTTVTFPNHDSIFHNVFSLSPGNTFDLGTYRTGDKPGEVALHSAGVVQVFCNLHSQMSASVLVTPSRHYAMVNKDGSFELTDLPPGRHRLVAWMPNADPVSREVDISVEAPAELTFTLATKASASHTNKFGQPYGSYQE